MKENKSYGAIIKDQRVNMQLTQQALADIVGKEQSYISGIESGNINPSTEIFMEIMSAMGCRVAVTVNGSELKSNDI